MPEIIPARSLDHFEAVHRLIDEMAEWDVAETRARGFDSDELRRVCYNTAAEELAETFAMPRSGMFVGGHAEQIVGCAGFGYEEIECAEVRKFFVRPAFRGHGIGRALMETVLDGIKRNGYRCARIETANFMTEAIALYRAHGFRECPPFREPMADLGPITVFMERGL